MIELCMPFKFNLCPSYFPGFLRDPADLFRTWGATDGVYSVIINLPDAETAAAIAAATAAKGKGKGKGKEGESGDAAAAASASGGDEDSIWGAAVHGIGMWLKRDAKTGDVVVSWVDPGGGVRCEVELVV